MNNLMKKCPVTRPKQQGIALVELAIAIPAMLVVMLITAEITRVMYQYNTLTKLVRDGSRAISSHLLKGTSLSGLTSSDLQIAKHLVISGKPQGGAALLTGLSEDNVTITMNSLGAGGTQRYYVQVSAEYDYVPIFASIGGSGFLPESLQPDFTLSALSSMRAQ